MLLFSAIEKYKLEASGKLPQGHKVEVKPTTGHTGGSYQTGPKGVLEDYQKAKEYMIAKHKQKELETIAAIKSSTIILDREEVISDNLIDEAEKDILLKIMKEKYELGKMSSSELARLREEAQVLNQPQKVQKKTTIFWSPV